MKHGRKKSDRDNPCFICVQSVARIPLVVEMPLPLRLGNFLQYPIGIMLRGKPVYLCCKGCIGKAKQDPDGILKKITESQR